MQAIRRDLHRHPEAGWTEFRTTRLVERELRRLGYRVFVGGECVRRDAILGLPPSDVIERRRAEAGEAANGLAVPGVVGVLERGDSPTVALRFDMDATEVLESSEPVHRPAAEGFASERPGVMHACGHDGHVTIGLGVARALAAADSWRGRVKLVFQPAEEGGRGARPMVEAGVVVAGFPELTALPSHPLGGGEDATFFMRRVQERGGKAIYSFLGADARSGHHTATFDFDERALVHGVKLFTGLVLDLLGDPA